jgi:chromosome segregation ATPase
MQKELNTQLFPKTLKGNTEEIMSPAVESLINRAMTSSEEVQLLRRQVLRLQDQVTKLSSHFIEQNKNQQLKADRWVQALARLEQNQSTYAQENNEKVAQLASRISERKGSDFKIQELFEQQNILLKNYEERFQKLQKGLSGKEIQINTIAGQLNEAQAEISRLKRVK